MPSEILPPMSEGINDKENDIFWHTGLRFNFGRLCDGRADYE